MPRCAKQTQVGGRIPQLRKKIIPNDLAFIIYTFVQCIDNNIHLRAFLNQRLKQDQILCTSGFCFFPTVLLKKSVYIIWNCLPLLYQLPDDCAEKVFHTLCQLLFVIAVDECKPYTWDRQIVFKKFNNNGP